MSEKRWFVHIDGEEVIEVKPNSVLFGEGRGELIAEPAISFGTYKDTTMIFTVNGVSWRTEPVTKRYVQMIGVRNEPGDQGPKGSPIVVEWGDDEIRSGLRVTQEPAVRATLLR